MPKILTSIGTSPFDSPDVENINKSQQDIDLLVAFDAAEAKVPSTHLVLIEAKAYLGWINGQLSGKPERPGKTERLRRILVMTERTGDRDAAFRADDGLCVAQRAVC